MSEERKLAELRQEEVRRCLLYPVNFYAVYHTETQGVEIGITATVDGVIHYTHTIRNGMDIDAELSRTIPQLLSKLLVDLLCHGLPGSWELDDVFTNAVDMLSGPHFESECASFYAHCLAEFLRNFVPGVFDTPDREVCARASIVEGRTDYEVGNTVYLFYWTGMQEPTTKRVSALNVPKQAPFYSYRPSEAVRRARQQRLAEVIEDAMYVRSTRRAGHGDVSGTVLHTFDNPGAGVADASRSNGRLLHRTALDGLWVVAGRMGLRLRSLSAAAEKPATPGQLVTKRPRHRRRVLS